MKILYSEYTDVGGRGNNEDALATAVAPHGHLYLVADGLGGHDNGEEASGIAVEAIKQRFMEEGADFNPERAISLANDLILKKQEEEGSSMKTTITLAWVGESLTYLCHVGDSRIYAFDSKGIVYQSPDHSVSQMAVVAGEITLAEIRNHNDRNKLTRALGVSEDVKAHTYVLDNGEYTGLLLCSDGFWEYVYEDEMLSLMNGTEDPKTWLGNMRVLHDRRVTGGHDNNTAIAVMKPCEKQEITAPVSAPAPVQASAPAPSATQRFNKVPAPPAPKAKSNKKTVTTLAIIAVVLLIAVLGLVLYIFFGNKDEDKKKSNKTTAPAVESGEVADGESSGAKFSDAESFEVIGDSEKAPIVSEDVSVDSEDAPIESEEAPVESEDLGAFEESDAENSEDESTTQEIGNIIENIFGF